MPDSFFFGHPFPPEFFLPPPLVSLAVCLFLRSAGQGLRRVFRRRSLAAAVAASAAVWAPAAENAEPRFVVRSWLVDEGLPHNVVNRLVQDGAGFLWLATGAGLARFDGRDFKLWPLPLRPAGGNMNVRDLALESPTSVLLLPASGGVVRFRERRFENHPASASLADQSLVDLFVEPGGTLWLGTETETVVRWEAGRTTTFGPKDGLNRRGNRFSFALDHDGHVWVAGGDFVGTYRDGHLQPLPGGPWNSAIIAPARSGGVWISTFEQLLKWEDGHLTVVAKGPLWPVARGTVHYLFEDRGGDLWMATRRDGLFRLAAGKLAPVPTATLMITAITEDLEGNLWATTEGGGIERLKPKEFVLIDRPAGLKEDVSTSVCVDAQGAIWCANRNGGLVRYADGRAEVVASSAVGAEFFAISVCVDRENRLWAAMAGGLYRVGIQAPYPLEKIPFAGSPARVLFCARSGDVWVGTGTGSLGYFHEGKYQEVAPNSGGPGKRVSAIAEAPAGGIWVATRDGGLAEYRDGHLIVDQRGAGLPAGSINTLFFDQAGALWVGTPEGLRLFRGNTVSLLTKADGLPDDFIDQIAEDDQGRLWIGSRRGLYCVSLSELKARADGQRPPVIGTTFGKDEGLVGTTSLSGVQPGVGKAADGHLWFVTHRGVVGLDPARLSRARPPPAVLVDEIRIDGRVTAGAINLAPGDHRVDFNFVALNFSAPERVRVRHRLVGMDLDWIETATEHTATYPRLPPGEYQMRVIACNQDGAWSDRPTVVNVSVAAAWWQTAWAQAAALLGAMGLVVWMARSWSHRRLRHRLSQLERENALERERARIARDLHDELGGSLTQIRLLAERIKRHTDQPEFKNFAGQLAQRARQLGGELESIIWTVSPRNNSWERLGFFISQYALKFFRDTSIACSVSGADRIPPRTLRPEEQHNLLAVAKEALNNILKHSQAGHATIELAADNGLFVLRIHDDGVGFDPARRELAACNGLNNMRVRLREIGGEIQIDSVLGQGTTITVRHRMGSASRRGSAPAQPAADHPL